jgi:hypothetical protein
MVSRYSFVFCICFFLDFSVIYGQSHELDVKYNIRIRYEINPSFYIKDYYVYNNYFSGFGVMALVEIQKFNKISTFSGINIFQGTYERKPPFAGTTEHKVREISLPFLLKYNFFKYGVVETGCQIDYINNSYLRKYWSMFQYNGYPPSILKDFFATSIPVNLGVDIPIKNLMYNFGFGARYSTYWRSFSYNLFTGLNF